jgi:glycosyltransferase involved in cell wall biosynthesis
MRIVHILFSFHTGGIETMLVDILDYQCKEHQTHLIIINNEFTPVLLETLAPTVNVHFINRTPGSRNPLPIISLNLLLRKIQPTIVHMHDAIERRILFPVLCGRFQKLLTMHDVNKPCRNLDHFDQIFAISKAVQNDLAKRCRIKTTVIHNGIEFSNISRKNLALHLHQPIRIVQISRLLHEKKGQHLLIEAQPILKKTYGIMATITFIGDGPSKEYLKKLAHQLNETENCIFAGSWSRKRIYENLFDFDILVQPSLYEGFGLTVVEGIAAGLPVIASDLDGPAEILERNRYGWVFKTGETSSLAETISTVVKNSNTEEFRTKINQSYEHARIAYNIRDTAKTYLEAYASDNNHDR